MLIFSFMGYFLRELFRKPDNWRQIYKQITLTFYTSSDVSKTCLEEKNIRTSLQIHFFENLLGFTTLRNGCLITFKKMQKQPPEVFYRKVVPKNFAIFTVKYLFWSLFLIQNIAKFLRASILKNICKQVLLKMCSSN